MSQVSSPAADSATAFDESTKLLYSVQKKGSGCSARGHQIARESGPGAGGGKLVLRGRDWIGGSGALAGRGR